MIQEYLSKIDWTIKENSNTSYSLQGLNNYIVQNHSKEFWLDCIYPKEIADSHRRGDFHIHDLGSLSTYCVGWDLRDLLCRGFGGVAGKIESKPPKHLSTALGQIVNFFYTLQGESSGAQAFANFDTLLAPFIHYDKIERTQLKQLLQEFIFNLNVPTRVGFQCMSEDTEILTKKGWKKHNEVSKGDIIATFNVDSQQIEYLPVKKMFAREYSGKMYRLKNRITDQLVSPKHRIVRRKNNSMSYVVETIEEVIKHKSPTIIPVGSKGHPHNWTYVDIDKARLIAWIVADGTREKNCRGVGRISIYQSEEANPEKYQNIIDLLNEFNLSFTDRKGPAALGRPVNQLRLNSESTRTVLEWFENEHTKSIPEWILCSGPEVSQAFLESYIQGDGHEGCKITTTSSLLVDQLQHVAVNAGYGVTVHKRKKISPISKKEQYVLRLVYHKDTYVSDISEVDYSGVIWCPNTQNETVVARRKGKVFITGNTPFTNLTMDLVCPKALEEEGVIIGGELWEDYTYGDFQDELDLFNSVFFEVLAEGDGKGRVFTFPIPTVNIVEGFDYSKECYSSLWSAAAKYGIPYFANFINSDLDVEDARSMCCRLRLDNTVLRSRGGGLFGSNPLTGSIGVVTINLPRLAKHGNLFWSELDRLVELAADSLETKRKYLEDWTNHGLFPYCSVYLESIRQRTGNYWNNHFSTIGIIGAHECCQELLSCGIDSDQGILFANRLLEHLRKKLTVIQATTGNLYNLEATPAEGAGHRLALADDQPSYTNSTQLPVDYSGGVMAAMENQNKIQHLYTGGTVFHVFAGEADTDSDSLREFVLNVCKHTKLPYITYSPTFSICSKHGYISGEHKNCPTCGKVAEIYTRVVGYLSPVHRWNAGKKAEFKQRVTFDVNMG